MADIHLRIDEDGLTLWRTTRSPSGTRVRSKGVEVKLKDKSEITPDLPIFRMRGIGEVSLGESYGNPD